MNNINKLLLFSILILVIIIFIILFIYFFIRRKNKISFVQSKTTTVELFDFDFGKAIELDLDFYNTFSSEDKNLLDIFFNDFLPQYYIETKFVFKKIMPSICDSINENLDEILKDFNFTSNFCIYNFFVYRLMQEKTLEKIIQKYDERLLMCYGISLFKVNYEISVEECSNDLHVACENIIRNKLSEIFDNEKINESKLMHVVRRFNVLFTMNMLDYVKNYIVDECGRWFNTKFKENCMVPGVENEVLIKNIGQEFINIISKTLINPNHEVFTARNMILKFPKTE